jgi:N-methylhydantoinase A
MTDPGTAPARIGVDIGGTFTDLAAIGTDGRFHLAKVLTTHGAEDTGVLGALDAVADLEGERRLVAHGTTLVINALLERKGARTALVTTAGFGDVLELARANRPELFTLTYTRNEPLVPAELRHELPERTTATGEILVEPSAADLAALVDWVVGTGAEAVAVAFVNSYRRPQNEDRVAEYLAERLPGVPVTTSSAVSRQWREYERFTTAAANAYVAPVAERYLGRLETALESRGSGTEFLVLDSSGGALSSEQAARLPVRVVESGPVAGVVGAGELAGRLGLDKVVTFDMGGTTAKTSLIEAGRYVTTDLYWIGGYSRGFPLQVPTVDIIEVGAGGGSIAHVDEAGSLRVGPRSAGSMPGPACYGGGGTEPTITDANLHCGRLDPRNLSGLTLDEAAARRALEPLAAELGMTTHRLALGILTIGTLSMAAAVRRQTLEQGHDPREFAMVAIGGAGPMHACAVAAEVGIRRVVVPPHPGHFCALGMLGADMRMDRTEIVLRRLDEADWTEIHAALDLAGKELSAELAAAGRAGAAEITVRLVAGLRYAGQEHTLPIPFPTADDPAAELRALFETEYARRYGHKDAGSAIELVDVEIVATRSLPRPAVAASAAAEPGEGGLLDTWFHSDAPVSTRSVARAALDPGTVHHGPLVVFEEGATTVVPPGAELRLAEDGSLVIDLV